jgi:DNA-binding NtrC family response regulator
MGISEGEGVPTNQVSRVTTEGPDEARPIAIIDDDPTTRMLLRRWLEATEVRVVEFPSATEALRSDESFLVACVDLTLDDMGGVELLRHLIARDPNLPVVMVTAAREVEPVVEAMRAGAYDYVTKPVDRGRFEQCVRRAIDRRQLIERVGALEQRLGAERAKGRIVGESQPMRQLMAQVGRVRDSDVAVCLFGESGTGKELVARAIHESGRRAAGPFVALNCASIPPSLQESELFGHERGAFTGALAARRGCFELARGGTLFLDELGEMSASAQAALLRAIQERTIRRVGGSTDIAIDVRIVCATHRNLRQLVDSGHFREDLYFRLVVFPLQLPPLRDRSEDIPLLVGHFVRHHQHDAGRTITGVVPDAMDALVRYSWPGNVRELGNVIHRAMLCCDGTELRLSHLPAELQRVVLQPVPTAPHVEPDKRAYPDDEGDVVPLRELERRAIRRAIRATGGNLARAASLLGIGRATLYRRLAEDDEGSATLAPAR